MTDQTIEVKAEDLNRLLDVVEQSFNAYEKKMGQYAPRDRKGEVTGDAYGAAWDALNLRDGLVGLKALVPKCTHPRTTRRAFDRDREVCLDCGWEGGATDSSG